MGSATSTWPSRRSSTSSCRVKSSKQKNVLFFFFEKIKIKISFRIFGHSEKKNHPHHQNFEISFHEFFLIFLVSFFANSLNTTAAPHIILIFVLEKKHSIFVRIIWKLIS